MRKQLIAIVLSTVLSVSVLGCNHNSQVSEATKKTAEFLSIDEKDIPDCFYEAIDLDAGDYLDADKLEVYSAAISGNRIYMLVGAESKYYLQIFDETGRYLEQATLSIPELHGPMSKLYADDEELYLFSIEYDGFSVYSLRQENHSSQMTQQMHIDIKQAGNSYCGVIGYMQGVLYVLLTDGENDWCEGYDLTKRSLVFQSEKKSVDIAGEFFWIGEDLFSIEISDVDGTKEVKRLLEKGLIGDLYTIKTEMISGHFFVQHNVQFVSNRDGLYSYNSSSKKWEKRIVWKQSGRDQVAFLTNDNYAVSEQQDFVLVYTMDSGKTQLLRKSDGNLDERIEISLAGVNVRNSKRWNDLIQAFNSKNDKYRFVLKDYCDQIDEDGFYMSHDGSGYSEYLEAVKGKLWKDVVSGQGPDLMIRDYTAYDIDNLTEFNSTGMDNYDYYIDLLPLWKSEPEEWRDMFFSLPFEEAETRGYLKTMPMCFQVETLAKSRNCKIDDSADCGQWLNYMQNQSEYRYLVWMEKKEFLYHCLVTNLTELKRDPALFNTQYFRDLLLLTDQFCISSEQMNDDRIEWNYDTDFAFSDMVTSCEGFFHSRNGISEQLRICEDFSYFGFPSVSGTCSLLNYSGIAITSSCRNESAAWEFIKFALKIDQQEYQIKYKEEFYEIPILKEAFYDIQDCLMNPDKYPNYWEDDFASDGDGVQEEWHGYSKEEVKLYEDWLLTDKNVGDPDKEIIDIVLEETAAFFVGQKTMDDVISVINNRVQKVLDERGK